MDTTAATSTAVPPGERRRFAAALSATAQLAGPLEFEPLTGGRSNITYKVTDGETEWVLRTPPPRGLTSTAHDVLREYRITTALHAAGFPVAKPLNRSSSDDDGPPFAIWAYVHGTTFRTAADLDRVDARHRDRLARRLVEGLAALHSLDPDSIGLTPLRRPGHYAERQLRRWTQQWSQVGLTRLDSLASRVAAGLGSRLPSLDVAAVVHGDYRIDNTIMTDDAKIAAVVDWELATIGNPTADLATMCVYRSSAFDLLQGYPTAWASQGLPDTAWLAAAYESCSGRSLDDWPFYRALAAYKIAVIAAGVHHREQLNAVAEGVVPNETASLERSAEVFLEEARSTLTDGL